MKQSSIIPSPERVAVKRVESDKKSKGGIYIPDAAQEKQTIAYIVAVGSKVEWPAVGNKVIFGKYTGTEIKLGEENLVMMDVKDVLGVVND